MMKRIFGDDSSFVSSVTFQAEWRGRKAAEYPEDDRNLESAEGLEALATWIKAHPTAPVLVALDPALDLLYAGPSYELYPDIDQRLGRYCFGHPDTPEAFLAGLVKEIREHLKRELVGGES